MNENDELMQLDTELLGGYIQSLGHDIVKQMITLYKQQSLHYLTDIENALLSDNAKNWKEHCHKMKGAAGSVGLKALHARTKLMETTDDCTTEKARLLAELKIHNKRAIADFYDWLESL
jgi:HPt (histidine-containing phosphotransfer) domain-containing protein